MAVAKSFETSKQASLLSRMSSATEQATSSVVYTHGRNIYNYMYKHYYVLYMQYICELISDKRILRHFIPDNL